MLFNSPAIKYRIHPSSIKMDTGLDCPNEEAWHEFTLGLYPVLYDQVQRDSERDCMEAIKWRGLVKRGAMPSTGSQVPQITLQFLYFQILTSIILRSPYHLITAIYETFCYPSFHASGKLLQTN